MYFPSNNWYVVRKNMVGTWQVEAQQGCFHIPCPSRYKAYQVRDFLMTWLRNSHFCRLDSIRRYVHMLLEGRVSFDEFYHRVKVVHFADLQEF